MDWPHSTDCLHELRVDGRVVLRRHEARTKPDKPPSGTDLQALLFDAAQKYVEACAAEIGLAQSQVAQLAASIPLALDAKRPTELDSPEGQLGWLAFDTGQPEGSFRVERRSSEGPFDVSAVLLAGTWVRDGNGLKLRQQQALRVVAHARPSGDGWKARVTGITVSIASDEGPRGALAQAPAPAQQPIGGTLVSAEMAQHLVARDPVTKNGAGSRNRFALPIDDRETRASVLEAKTIGGIKTADDKVELRHPGRFSVLASDDRFGEDPKGDPVRTLVAGASQDLASPKTWAATASFHAERLFAGFTAWGFDPAALLRFVKLPLFVRYLATVNGSHGNAQVRWRSDDPLAPPSLRRRRLEVRFGYAPQGGMSLCCDPRWQWHEFGHVALAGTTGSPELPFAHSIGDAMSAIFHDPGSLLAGDASERGRTFPWVCSDAKAPYVGPFARFHDRRVGDGWGWQRVRVGGSDNDQQRLYRMEQVLSSTLFLLYRTLGGDCVDRDGRIDGDGRAAAANHALYLIVRALALLGPRALVEASTPDHLVSALIDADAGTDAFDTPHGSRRGGAARKPIRWAFERMGLYAGPGAAPDRPGRAPEVDLYIDDGRAGEYAPIDLNGTAWHAAAHALRIESADSAGAQRTLHLGVAIANRGSRTCRDASLTVWSAPLGAAPRPPDFPAAPWRQRAQVAIDEIVSGRVTRIPVVVDVDAAPSALLLAVSCPEDRANVDPATELPCADPQAAQPVNYLVGCDNNLAFAVV